MVLMTSTANDKLGDFGVGIASVTLTGTAGNSVVLYNNPNTAGISPTGPGEWMHLNGVSEPLVTVSVPQGTYISAIVKAGGCGISVVQVSTTGGLGEYIYAQEPCPLSAGNTTVNLPSPITISGPAMVLSLNLQIPQSYTLTASGTSAPASYAISPVFTLTQVAISSPPTNEQNGKIGPILSQITSVNSDGNSFVAQTADLVSINVSSDDSTIYQGIAGFSSLAVGMLVDVDLAIQPDASLLATRVEVPDAASPTVFSGPVFEGPNAPEAGQFRIWPIQQEEGCNDLSIPLCGIQFQFNTNIVFGISGQFSNLQDLPFAASFGSSSLFLGQNVLVFSPGIPGAQAYEGVTTLTLVPQTINGTVTAVSNSNGFTVYTVALAPYDMIPTGQQATLNWWSPNKLNNPATVIVHADANTQLLNSTPINPGSVLRFTGLIFDDNGTLRMDCGQILDGVPE
jgi:hypothetical protein